MTTDILQTIMAHKRRLTAARRVALPEARLEALAAAQPPARSLAAALRRARPAAIIAEFKRRSPSCGWISRGARVEPVVAQYASGGAAALSILTDEAYFGGTPADLQAARAATGLPILCKDFILSPYQLLEARAAGADAVLLIAAALSRPTCRRLAQKARELGMEVLLELHDAREADYLEISPDMVGVNNRHLGSLHTDSRHALQLIGLLPEGLVRVAESGIRTPAELRRLQQAGYDAFLIGTALMRSAAPQALLRQLIQPTP